MEPRDWSPFVEAGLLRTHEPDHAARRDLLEFLLDQGCALDEMVDADRRGRLFALAGDRIIRSGARTLTLAEVAERTGGDEGTVRRLWRALGLVGWDSDAPVASAEEAAALTPMVRAVTVIGEDLTVDLARSMGAALSRIGEATNAILRSLSPRGAVATSENELDTAKYWARGAPFLPALGRVLDVFSRHHHDLAREHFERSDSVDLMPRRRTRVAVGFVDISGFTTAAEHLDEIEFARLITTFSAAVGETVHDLGGRVVKFVGDAAMIVAPDALVLASIVYELVESWTSVGEGLTLHAGLSQGEVLSQDGDYFGSAVNIAARLVALASPGSILATAPVGEVLSEARWSIEWLEPRPIRGIADPIVTCLVHHRAGSG